jgi:hypothetical protein
MEPLDFAMHKGARTSLIIVGVLLCLLCVTAPFGIYIFIRIGSCRVRLANRTLEARGLVTDTVNLDDVERAGVLRIPMVARGVGGALARMKLDNMNEGVNLVFRLKNGKDVKFAANQYERHTELLEKVSAMLGKPLETIPMGLLSWKWPERA